MIGAQSFQGGGICAVGQPIMGNEGPGQKCIFNQCQLSWSRGATGEAGIDTTHSLSRSGGNIQCLILTLFIYDFYHCQKVQATKLSKVQRKCIIRFFSVQDLRYSPVMAESLVVEESLMMND